MNECLETDTGAAPLSLSIRQERSTIAARRRYRLQLFVLPPQHGKNFLRRHLLLPPPSRVNMQCMSYSRRVMYMYMYQMNVMLVRLDVIIWQSTRFLLATSAAYTSVNNHAFPALPSASTPSLCNMAISSSPHNPTPNTAHQTQHTIPHQTQHTYTLSSVACKCTMLPQAATVFLLGLTHQYTYTSIPECFDKATPKEHPPD